MSSTVHKAGEVRIDIDPAPVVRSGDTATITVFVSLYHGYPTPEGAPAGPVPAAGATVWVKVWRLFDPHPTQLEGTTDANGFFVFKWTDFKLPAPASSYELWLVSAAAQAYDWFGHYDPSGQGKPGTFVVVGDGQQHRGKYCRRFVLVCSQKELVNWDLLGPLLKMYSSYKPNLHGYPSISSLSTIDAYPQYNIDDGAELVLILVNSRLVPLVKKGVALIPIIPHLMLLQSLLNSEGYRARIVVADIYPPEGLPGPKKHDGLTLLALRDFFKAVKKDFPGFRGAILVGNFPDAMLCRSSRPTSDPNSKYKTKVIAQVGDKVSVHLAYRGDIVLADLSGNWGGTDQLGKLVYDAANDWFFINDYEGGLPAKAGKRDEKTPNANTPDDVLVPSKEAKKDPEVGGKHRGLLRASDFDHTKDLDLQKEQKERFDDEKRMYLDWKLYKKSDQVVTLQQDPTEGTYSGGAILGGIFTWYTSVGPQVRGIFEYNRLAIPDILVSRINAWHLTKDEAKERQLLFDYLTRNIVYRSPASKGYLLDRRYAGIACMKEGEKGDVLTWKADTAGPELAFAELPCQYWVQGYTGMLKKADFSRSQDLIGEASLLDFVKWLRYHPALLRSLGMHGSARDLDFSPHSFLHFKMEKEIGKKEVAKLFGPLPFFPWIPVWINAKTSQELFEIIWENNLMSSQQVGSFYSTGSCLANAPHKRDELTYVDTGYGISNGHAS